MDRELFVFYKKHGIPLEDAAGLLAQEPMPPAAIHRSEPMGSCLQAIANEVKQAKSNRLREARLEEQMKSMQQSLRRAALECQSLKQQNIATTQTHNQQKSDLLIQIMLLFSEVNRLRNLAEVLSQRNHQSQKTLSIIRSDYDSELQKSKVLMASECQEQLTYRKYKKAASAHIERIQSQYRVKMQELMQYQSNKSSVEESNDKVLQLLKKENALLELRNTELEKRIKTLTSDLKIAEADRRSQVENLNQERLSLYSQVNSLEMRLQDTEARLSKSMDAMKGSAQPNPSQRQLSRGFSKVAAELSRLEVQNKTLRSQLSQRESSKPAPCQHPQQIEELQQQLSKKSSQLSFKQQQAEMVSRMMAQLKQQHQREMEEKDERIRQLLDQDEGRASDEADYH